MIVLQRRRGSGRAAAATGLAVAVALTVGGCAMSSDGAGPESSATVRAAFAARLAELVDELRLPGAVAAYSIGDGPIEAVAAGWADVERGETMTVEHRMLAGSIGKTFVPVVALALAREGRLDLDDPVSRWLADEPWFERLPNGASMTLRHLLTHSAGLVDHVEEPAFRAEVARLRREHAASPEEIYLSPRRLISFALDRPPLFEAGRGFSYTDTGYLVAGLVLERAAGRPFYDEVRERLLEPLGLGRTSPADRSHLPGLASGYVGRRDGLSAPGKVADQEEMLALNPATEWTGGGFVSNAQDLVRWARLLYTGEALPFPYLDELVGSGYRGEDPKKRYGLGVFVRETELGRMWGHGGVFPGYNSSMYWFPDRRVAVAVQTNTSAGDPRDPLLLALAGTLLAELDASAGTEIRTRP